MLQTRLTSEPAENIRGAYVKEGEEWVLDELSKDHPTIIAKTGLETTQKTLRADLQTERDKSTRLESRQLPEGKIAVDPEVERLGLAAQAANLKPADISTLSTKAAELQKQIDDDANEKTFAEVAKATGRDVESLKEHAAAKGLKFETREETVDGNPAKKFVAVRKDGETEVKTDASEYFEKIAPHVKQAEDADGNRGGVPFPGQKPDGNNKPHKPTVETEIEAQAQTGRYAAL